MLRSLIRSVLRKILVGIYLDLDKREKLLYALSTDIQNAGWGEWADVQKHPTASQATPPGAASAQREKCGGAFPSEACHWQVGEGTSHREASGL